MTAYLLVTSVAGDRWDRIAWRYYRDLSRVPALIEANPSLPITPTLGAGWTVRVPVIEAPAVTDALPPWRR